MEKSSLEIQAALAALKALLITTAASHEDIVNDAIEIGGIFAGRYQTARAVEHTNDFQPNDGDIFYFPIKFRSGYVSDSDVWKGTRSQRSLQMLHLCFENQSDCIELCKRLNEAYP